MLGRFRVYCRALGYLNEIIQSQSPGSTGLKLRGVSHPLPSCLVVVLATPAGYEFGIYAGNPIPLSLCPCVCGCLLFVCLCPSFRSFYSQYSYNTILYNTIPESRSLALYYYALFIRYLYITREKSSKIPPNRGRHRHADTQDSRQTMILAQCQNDPFKVGCMI